MNWQTLKAEIAMLLEDTAFESYVEPLVIAAFNRAQDFFAAEHTARLLSVTVEPTAVGDTSKIVLPGDWLQLAGISVGGRWLEPFTITPGYMMPEEGFTVRHGEIFFPEKIAEANLWYYALYPHVEGDDSEIALPPWAVWPLENLCIAYMLTPFMIGQASLRRFQQRREAGDPIDNPPRNQAEYHLGIYKSMVSNVKPQDRDILR